MKTPSLFLCAALALSFGAPLGAYAQQAPNVPASPPQDTMQHRHGHGFMRMLHGVNLSDQQKTQIHQLMQQYRQAHPEGNQPDPQARKQLRDQVMGVLTPQQQAQVKANIAQMHANRPEPQATP
jgi:Spy/CpxP family protein refolding chaperone